jgi:hypothetical protein
MGILIDWLELKVLRVLTAWDDFVELLIEFAVGVKENS